MFMEVEGIFSNVFEGEVLDVGSSVFEVVFDYCFVEIEGFENLGFFVRSKCGDIYFVYNFEDIIIVRVFVVVDEYVIVELFFDEIFVVEFEDVLYG